ncbi:chemotaxis-specific protein-glutamate methyltransferase CheB [Sphingomonas sp. S1-29]|uniref:chemotaxis-specific protein-glutamate methyltransferase CheB n=1 Tax=Sphingomonas sp. S1-29 TaxID=2991074 RepID=UPI00223FEAD1|nr:chemotaxis-specific protein-glutamate methyltransferase CheB [Sphingomonas sp. S1-29]UZK69809.1 chemotaxis-specific protein-glutamate methyltransferase CheB [Sphingomonas sp. S1-29]
MATANARTEFDVDRRVLIVDDSAVARAVLRRVVEATPGHRVARGVANASAALDYLKSNVVEVVLLDIDMPGIDGLAALPDILAAGQGAHVIVVSSACGEGAAATIDALALGASDTLGKPALGNFAGLFVRGLRERLERLALAEPQAVAVPPKKRAGVASRPDVAVLAIGASTGGIHALSKLLRALPATFQAPILITQHLPVSFMPYFAAQVAVLANRPCGVATDHLRLRSGEVVIAPGDAHIRCVATSDGFAIRLLDKPVANGCMPSADPMFASVAQLWGARAIAVVLSGMGRDGAEGAQAVAAAGGMVLAQDRATSVVWGMPGAVAEAGIADAILPPEAIGALVGRQGRGR